MYPGFWQIVLVLVIVLVLFGAGRLPQVMGDLAKGVRNFKSGLKEADPGSEAPAPAPAPRAIGEASGPAPVHTASAHHETHGPKAP